MNQSFVFSCRSWTWVFSIARWLNLLWHNKFSIFSSRRGAQPPPQFEEGAPPPSDPPLLQHCIYSNYKLEQETQLHIQTIHYSAINPIMFQAMSDIPAKLRYWIPCPWAWKGHVHGTSKISTHIATVPRTYVVLGLGWKQRSTRP
jgi:hypothetical protein